MHFLCLWTVETVGRLQDREEARGRHGVLATISVLI